MTNVLFLIIFVQIFHVFGQANTHDRLSVRSSALDEVSSTSFVKRKTTTKEQPMNCEVAKDVRREGLASDCYTAIAALYDPKFGFPPCAIFHSCVAQPLDKAQQPMGGVVDQQGQPHPPPLTLQQMNKAYDIVFSYKMPKWNFEKCENYVLPSDVAVDADFTFKAGDMFPTFILKVESTQGQGDTAEACNPTLQAKVLKEAL